MPFRLNTGTEGLNGELVLGDSDPLPILTGQGVADNDAFAAWTCALLGFADATCIELEPTEPAARRASAGPRRQPPLRYPSDAPRGRPCHERGDGRATSSRLATGSATAARSWPVTGAVSTMAKRPATRPVTARAKSGSSSTRTRHGSGHTPAASLKASRCVSGGTRRPSSNSASGACAPVRARRSRRPAVTAAPRIEHSRRPAGLLCSLPTKSRRV
jgi:hypothetical protein